MNLKSAITWLIFLAVTIPFLAYGLGQFLPFYDGFIVTSGSMEPEIQTGSVLFTHKVAAEKIMVGDTITFEDGDSFTTHKVIEKNTDPLSFKTQGVANSSPDPGTVTENEIVGKKLFSIPYLGYIISAAGTQIGTALLIIIPGAILILMELRTIYSEMK